MSDEEELREEQLPLEGAGQTLTRAREQAGMSIDQVAAETRIPLRQLESIEAGDFSALPSRTYAIGFSRSYARAVGLDETEIADQVRSDLADRPYHNGAAATSFEPADSERVPGRGLAWFSAFAAILLLVGAFAFFRGYFLPGSGPAPLVGEEQIAENDDIAAPSGTGEAGAAEAPSGPVVFTALKDNVWVRFYDGTQDNRLLETVMASGERYTIPADADNPQINTGQPEALSITIGGDSIGTLSNESEVISDIQVTAEALIARRDALEADAAANAASPADEG